MSHISWGKRDFYFIHMKRDKKDGSCRFQGHVIYILFVIWNLLHVFFPLVYPWNPDFLTVSLLKRCKRRTEYIGSEPSLLRSSNVYGCTCLFLSGLFPNEKGRSSGPFLLRLSVFWRFVIDDMRSVCGFFLTLRRWWVQTFPVHPSHLNVMSCDYFVGLGTPHYSLFWLIPRPWE